MKKFLGVFILLGLTAGLMLSLPAEAKVFKTCNELRKTYKYGVAQSTASATQQASNFQMPRVSSTVYKENRKLDVDKDGVVCEVKKPGSTSENSSARLPSEGKACTTIGQKVKVFDRTFSCLKTGASAKWSKGELDVNYVYSTDDGYLQARSQYCSIDPDAGKQWEKFQTYILREARNCPFQLRFLTYEMGKKSPTTQPTNFSSVVEPCKVGVPNKGNWIKGFEEPDRRLRHNVLGRNAILQIIPIYAPDTAAPANSPLTDYGKYFDFVEKYVSEVSDLPTTFDIRVPEQYFKFSKPLKPYGVTHKLPSPKPEVIQEIMDEVDRNIDFTGATSALVLVPAGTRQDVWQQGPLGFFRNQEATMYGISSQYPATEKLLSARPEFLNLSVPGWWVHEFYHVGVGLDDHYGSTQQDRSKVTGMGFWGLMSPGLTDLLGWEKWILDYIGDSQVSCVTQTSETQNLWLRPSSVNTTEQKLAVVRLSSTKVIVMESIRGAGLNHFLAPNEQGLLVYTVDAANREHGFGFDLQYPRSRQILSGNFAGSFAPLKTGETVSVEGVEIKVVEAGNFGDVISISKSR